MIVHYKTCNAKYPEKPADEQPQQIVEMELDDNEVVRQCVDCGAFEVVEKLEAAHG